MKASLAIAICALYGACSTPSIVKVEGAFLAAPCASAGACERTSVLRFQIDRRLVTVPDYETCVAERKCVPGRGLFSRDPQEVARVPIEGARQYCASKGAHVTSDVEWQAAAGGPARLRYPWGNVWDERKLVAERVERGKTHTQKIYTAAGTRPDVVSPFGVEDLAGAGPELVTVDDPPGFARRGCSSQSHGDPRRDLEQACDLNRPVPQPPEMPNAQGRFRCVYREDRQRGRAMAE